ncbi:MAG TPA: outer membrane protein assembly factor BamD [Longimicrobiaceae bacterium]|nr:outer membrane protein assembly factor BamD [Longimicrobiaceae bacterium]
MIRFPLRRIFLTLPFALVVGGCGRNSNPAQLGPDALYERGTTAYRTGKYGRAVDLLNRFLQAHLGDPRAAEARMTLGRAHMARREYILAAGEFTRLLNETPPDSLQRSARFGICEAYRRLSPRPQLDQEYTGGAIAHCESVATYYPGTQEAAQAAEWVRDLKQKLAQKSYDTGMFYFKRGAYDAAVIYFTETVEQYPDTVVAAAALLKLLQSYETIGYKEEAADARARLLREYPQSPEARTLQGTAGSAGS